MRPRTVASQCKRRAERNITQQIKGGKENAQIKQQAGAGTQSGRTPHYQQRPQSCEVNADKSGQDGKIMKIYRVYYYLNWNCRTTAYKDVKAETSEQAIKRARVKNIISLEEL